MVDLTINALPHKEFWYVLKCTNKKGLFVLIFIQLHCTHRKKQYS